MKLLFISNLYPPNVVGGYERLCHDVASALATRGHEVMVLTSDFGAQTADYAGQVVRREMQLLIGPESIYQPFVGDEEARAAIARHNRLCFDQAMREFSPDIVFVWNLYFLDATLLQAIQHVSVPTVFLLTDNWLIAFLRGAYLQRFFAESVFSSPANFMALIKARIKGLLSRGPAQVKLSSRAIFASHFMASLYRDAGFGFQSSTIIYHGIQARQAQRTPPPRNIECQAGELRLLFAGRVVEIKGVHTAIEALPYIISSLPKWRVHLTILGERLDAAYDQRLDGLVDRLHLREQITFSPSVAEAELDDLFAHHDIYLFPSLYEPFSLTLIHALRAGIPTIASDAGGNVEIVKHGQTGMLFKRGNPRSLAEQVTKLTNNPELRARVARNGADTAEGYTFTRMIDQVEKYLEIAS